MCEPAEVGHTPASTKENLSSLYLPPSEVPSLAWGSSEVERFCCIAADHYARAVCNVD